MRTLDFGSEPRIGTTGENVSLGHAVHWLSSVGLATAPADSLGQARGIALVAGYPDLVLDTDVARTSIVLWDFQTGRSGTGLHASAASGVSWVIGNADGPPGAVPVQLPEKWCGLVGANLALACLLDVGMREQRSHRRFDVSTADILRSLADQNAGNHLEVEQGWRRNGSIAVSHGGIYPQGYYPCRDGHIAIVGRSRNDWKAIRDVIDRPAWTDEARFDDPFALALDPEEADELLTAALANFDRDELLKRSIATGATIAPVYDADELASRGIVRGDFFADDGAAQLPFEIVRRGGTNGS